MYSKKLCNSKNIKQGKVFWGGTGDRNETSTGMETYETRPRLPVKLGWPQTSMEGNIRDGPDYRSDWDGLRRRWRCRAWWRSCLWCPLGTWARSTGGEGWRWWPRTASMAPAQCSQRGRARGHAAPRPAHGERPPRWRASRAEYTRSPSAGTPTWAAAETSTAPVSGWSNAGAAAGPGAELPGGNSRGKGCHKSYSHRGKGVSQFILTQGEGGVTIYTHTGGRGCHNSYSHRGKGCYTQIILFIKKCDGVQYAASTITIETKTKLLAILIIISC